MCLVDRRMHCEREHVDLDQTKHRVMIGFKFGALTGSFGGAFEQVAPCGKHSGILVHELRVFLLSKTESSG